MPGSTASASPERVLVVGVNWVGDAVMSMPAVQAWRARHPAAHLTMLVREPLAGLWGMHAAPDEVQVYAPRGPGLHAAIRAVRAGAFARAYVLPNSFRSAYIPFRAGVPERIGRRGRFRRFLLTRVAPAGPDGRHQAHEFLDVLAPGLEPEPPRLTPPDAARAAAAEALAGLPRPLVGIMPGAARGPAKRWPADYFAAVAVKLAAGGAGIAVFGTAAERELCATVAAAAPGARDFSGATTLERWAALLEACDALLGNDSGGMHVAAALGRPVAAVFGLTDPAKTGPLGGRAVIVRAAAEGRRDIPRESEAAARALAAVGPETVCAAVHEALRLGGARS